jgi:ATP-dependent Clp protease protease subunit
MNKFWKWVRNKAPDPDNPDQTIEERTLFLDGQIAEESWFDNDVTPALFKDELNAGKGDITVWINSPGGDCFAAAQIYNMLRDYTGKVTVKIDGIAASAASVIAMAGDRVLVSPVSMIMIHNPSTIAMGDHNEMEKAIEMLDSVKDSIINAYALRTGLSRNKLAKLMENETWMDANKAVELHFADSVIERDNLYGGKTSSTKTEEEDDPEKNDPKKKTGETEDDPDFAENAKPSMLFCRRMVDEAITNKVIDHYKKVQAETKTPETLMRKAEDCYARLGLLKTLM